MIICEEIMMMIMMMMIMMMIMMIIMMMIRRRRRMEVRAILISLSYNLPVIGDGTVMIVCAPYSRLFIDHNPERNIKLGDQYL